MYFAFPFTSLTSVYTSSLQDRANIEVCRRNIYAGAKCITLGNLQHFDRNQIKLNCVNFFKQTEYKKLFRFLAC